MHTPDDHTHSEEHYTGSQAAAGAVAAQAAAGAVAAAAGAALARVAEEGAGEGFAADGALDYEWVRHNMTR